MLAARHQPRRQDTLELREHAGHDAQYQQEQIHNGQQYQQHYASDEEHSILEDDSGDEQYIEDEDDNSSSLSIPSESIDFDLVYSIQTFVATVEGQANVVKGDSLFLMDDSNSYWWLVRVLKTQEVGYIPAENIETPFERLARLNKHRNVDVSVPGSIKIARFTYHVPRGILASCCYSSRKARRCERCEGADACRDGSDNVTLQSRPEERRFHRLVHGAPISRIPLGARRRGTRNI